MAADRKTAPVKHTKQSLSSLFQSEEQIGVRYGDSSTMQSREEYSGPPDEYDEIAWLPNDMYMGRCTHCARFVVKSLGEGEVYGFSVDENPVASEDIKACFGHDFAVVQGRYIVDIWTTLYAGIEKQVVYDLRDKRDHAKITEIYGDPKLWGMFSEAHGLYLKGAELPKGKLMQLHVKEPEIGMSM